MTQQDKPEHGHPTGKDTNKVDTLISGKLRQLYDGIIEEGTPDRLLDLLEQLDAAEQAAKARSGTS